MAALLPSALALFLLKGCASLPVAGGDKTDNRIAVFRKSVQDGRRDVHVDEGSEVDAATCELCEKSPWRCAVESQALGP